MALLKTPNVGVWESKTRLLQKKLSYERISLTWKTVKVWKYLGSRTNLVPAITDMDPVFMEVPDRAYEAVAIEINASWQLLNEGQMDLSKFGIINPLGNTHEFKFHTYSFEPDGLGRYIMVGDVLEVPFLTQDGNKVFYEVTDVDRKNENSDFSVIVTTTLLGDTQETEEIPGVNSDDAALTALMSEFDTQANADFTQGGLDTTGVTVTDPATRTPYDPRPDTEEDFLDNPNRQII